MPLLETLTTSVGAAVAKSLLKIWLRDEMLAQQVGLSLADMAQAKAKGLFERRSIERNFERIAEEVAKKLAPYLEVEFEDAPDNEVTAAVIAVQATIDTSRLTPELILASDLEPIRLEQALREGSPNITRERLLSDVGVQIYNFTIREAANYIVEIVTNLPNFQARATRELLERETTLIELVEEVLRQLPEAEGADALGDPGGFEIQYRREVVRKLDDLELFGVSTTALNRKYPLSVAYIGLTATASVGEKDPAAESDEETEEKVELGVEEVVARGSRSLIRGEAGSGKTTLLQWLAVSSARRRFEGQFKPWNDLVPFFIQLRRYVGESLPAPSEFPKSISTAVADVMPDDWVAEQLSQGRALVLIDGVDELGEAEREPAAEWLRDLLNLYPDAKYVVTSRPPAVSEDWLEKDGFNAAFLEPMDVPAIDSFIDHWHEASRSNAVDDEELEEFTDLARRLKTVIREAPQIRNLATSPLLCAMLCALHRDRKAQLPRARVELYRVALEMLLERRDIAREVVTEGIEMERPQKEVLLQGIAYWLLLNGFSDATEEDVLNLLRPKLEAIPRLEAGPEEVLKHLLLRSGLLREPVEGRIDFIHRTFQEYLTAKQTTDERSIGLLMDHAHEDQWQEVIILAAGQGVGDFSQQLIRQLLDRGSADSDLRHRYQLLAVACLETTQTLPKNLQEEIGEALRDLMPPKSMSEAKAIASAGEIAVPLLAPYYSKPVAVAAPCVRALGLIGGSRALAALEAFGGDKRVTVARELIRAWDYFPEEEYAARVLRDSVLSRGLLEVNTAGKLAGVRHLKHLDRLRCWSGPRGAADWEWSALSDATGIETLILDVVHGVTDFPTAALSPSVKTLEVRRSDIEQFDLSPIANLERLRLMFNRELQVVDGLPGATTLNHIALFDCPSLKLTSKFPASVRTLELRGVPELVDLNQASHLEALEALTLRNQRDLVDLAVFTNMGQIKTATLDNLSAVRSVEPILRSSELRTLFLAGCENLDLEELALAESLERLVLRHQGLTDAAPIAALPNLTFLSLSGNPDLESLEPLRQLGKIRELTLIGCQSLKNLEPLRQLEDLERLDLELCRGISDLSPIYELPNLRLVDLRGCEPEIDATPLKERGVRVVTGAGTPYSRSIYLRQASRHAI